MKRNAPHHEGRGREEKMQTGSFFASSMHPVNTSEGNPHRCAKYILRGGGA
jgi:hypothetical protein